MTDKKPSTYLMFVFGIICFQIVAMSFFSSHGGISPDSANYLRFATSEGMYVDDVFHENTKAFFAVWPVGYPFVIKMLAAIIPFDVIIVSKIVNILILALACFVINIAFPKHGYLYAMLFLSDSFIRVSYMTWSEVPFSISMIILSIGLYKYFISKNIKWLGVILLSALYIFLSRYIGLFVLAPIGITGLMFLYNRDYRNFTGMLFCGVITLLFASMYLWMNYSNVGSFTGIERVLSRESNFELIDKLITHQLKEIKIFLIISLIYLCYFFITKKNLKKENQTIIVDNQWVFFIMVGGVYWISIVIMRWVFHFDGFSNRLMAPSTLLFSFGILNYLLQYQNLHKHIKNILVIMVLSMLIYHLPIKFISNNMPVFSQIWHKKKEQYESLANESIVIFGELSLIYYNTKIQTAAAFPFYGEMADKQHMVGAVKDGESLDEFSNRLCKESNAKNIYLDKNNGREVFYYQQNYLSSKGKVKLHKSFEDAVKNKSKNNIVLLKECRV